MRSPLRPGQVYLDCNGHPVFCTKAAPVFRDSGPWRSRLFRSVMLAFGHADDWDLTGISLLDASRPRSCSARHCRPARAGVPLAAWRRELWDRGRGAAT